MVDQRLTNYLFRAKFDEARQTGRLAGPFHRKRSETQTAEDDQAQIQSGLLWGAVPQTGKCPTAQAYFGPLGLGEQGIEFFTTVLPQQSSLPIGFGANWYFDDTAFTGLLDRDPDLVAVIPIVVTRHVP